MNPIELFERSIKRDPSHFNSFKEGKYWETWQRNTLATARSQDVNLFLNVNYVTRTKDDADLFQEKQIVMCSVFSTTFQTYRGKKLVKEHEGYFYDQVVCSKLHDFCTKFEGDRVNASEMLRRITSAKFEAWKGRTESFTFH